MNLYLVLAIALGAISGVVETPVARPVLVAQRAVRTERREMRTFPVLGPQFSALTFFKPRTANRELRTLRGNTAPRAPAAV